MSKQLIEPGFYSRLPFCRNSAWHVRFIVSNTLKLSCSLTRRYAVRTG